MSVKFAIEFPVPAIGISAFAIVHKVHVPPVPVRSAHDFNCPPFSLAELAEGHYAFHPDLSYDRTGGWGLYGKSREAMLFA